MKQRIITGTIIAIITALAIASKLLPLTIGDYIFDVFVLAIMFVSGLEISTIFSKSGKNNYKIAISIYCVVNYIITLITINRFNLPMILLFQIFGLILYFFIIWIVSLLIEKKEKKNCLDLAKNSILCCFYPIFLLGLMININHVDIIAGTKYFSLIIILMVFAVTMLTDTFAFFVGITFKGPKLAPTISPKKTISGSIGGLIGGICGALLVYALAKNVSTLSVGLEMYNLNIWEFVLFGLAGSLVGQCGDLFESKIKRQAGVKDSGTIFPGHGGMLDRVDAMTFVVTFMFIALVVILA